MQNGPMPRISSFYGIVIRMYYDEVPHQGRPHCHATYGEHEASIGIETLDVLAGGLPKRALRLVIEWAELHREELRHNWGLARAAQALEPVDPLP
jgi:hypothetical protein